MLSGGVMHSSIIFFICFKLLSSFQPSLISVFISPSANIFSSFLISLACHLGLKFLSYCLFAGPHFLSPPLYPFTPVITRSFTALHLSLKISSLQTNLFKGLVWGQSNARKTWEMRGHYFLAGIWIIAFYYNKRFIWFVGRQVQP